MSLATLERRLPDAVETVVSRWLHAPAFSPIPLFAIGDVHGEAALLRALHERIRRIAAEMELAEGALIHLGDYIDRGPRSLEALELAFAGARIPGLADHCLPGNHEQFLREFLRASGRARQRILDVWLANGAHTVVQEIGLERLAKGEPDDADTPCTELAVFQLLEQNQEAFAESLAAALRSRLGLERLAKLENLPGHLRFGSYLFVHAGIHPSLGLRTLRPDWRKIPTSRDEGEIHPLWIRGPFLTYDGDFEDGLVVVHGHTPRPNPELRRNRIGIDTGACTGGALTAVQIDGERLRFIQARRRDTTQVARGFSLRSLQKRLWPSPLRG